MGTDSDGIIGLYQRHGTAWARARGTTLIEGTWLGRFAALLPARARILDIGCGSGMPIAGHLLAMGHDVTGIDTSPPLLALCRERFPAQTWRECDMRRMALGVRFDGLIAWDSFFHLDHDDQRAMFPVFAAHAAPGAALMFTSGPAHGIAMGSFGGEPLFHASLDPAEYRALLAANGFSVLHHHVVEDPACGGHTVWLACRG
jgi:SAM-dependent methyltransferase